MSVSELALGANTRSDCYIPVLVQVATSKQTERNDRASREQEKELRSPNVGRNKSALLSNFQDPSRQSRGPSSFFSGCTAPRLRR
jgi:hypothetical protein